VRVKVVVSPTCSVVFAAVSERLVIVTWVGVVVDVV
jgi:hypothetical protein